MNRVIALYWHSYFARWTVAVLPTCLLMSAVCCLLISVGSVTVARGQQGDEEFQRKMDVLRRRGKQQRQAGEERPPSPNAASGTEVPQVPGGVHNRNISATLGSCQPKYDRFRDRTALDMVIGTIYKTNSATAQTSSLANGRSTGVEELRLALAAATSGRLVGSTPPQQVEWYFQSIAPNYRYRGEAEVLMIIDGERVKVGHAYALGGTPIMGEVLERLRLRVPADIFTRIIKGREVEVKIGTNEFRLSSDVLKALRAFAMCAGLK